MHSLFNLFDLMLGFYVWVVILAALSSWMVAFDVINTRNRAVYSILDFLNKATDPVFRKIRRVIPAMGGIDVSPIVVILAIVFLRNLMREYGLLLG